MGFLLDHTRFGFCWLDLIAFVILACVVIYAFFKLKKAGDSKKDLQEKLDEIESRLSAEANEEEAFQNSVNLSKEVI